METIQIICIIAGIAAGLAVAFINMQITKKSYKTSNSAAGIMGANVLRLIFDFAALAVGYLICRSCDLPMIETLVAIAVGLSVGEIIFLRILINKIKKENSEKNEERSA